MSAQQDSRLEWTQLRSENTNTRQPYKSWQEQGTSTPFGTVTALTESQNTAIMRNQYLSAGTVCRASGLSQRGSCFHPSSPAVSDRESLRQFTAFPLSSVRHSCHIHLFRRLFVHTHLCARVHACPYTSSPLCLYRTLMQTHSLEACSCGDIGQTLIWQFSVSAARAG